VIFPTCSASILAVSLYLDASILPSGQELIFVTIATDLDSDEDEESREIRSVWNATIVNNLPSINV